ncbi:MAG TPA: hypothetical protein VN455_11200 [Methanotrichaceae archaeon]|nr:hypothetical protein [Methanotrichaceae archaeon]
MKERSPTTAVISPADAARIAGAWVKADFFSSGITIPPNLYQGQLYELESRDQRKLWLSCNSIIISCE